MQKITRISAALLVVAFAGPTPATAAGPYHPRPTTAYECSSLVAKKGAGSVWTGYFAGRRETGHDFDPYETVRIRACFVDGKACKNWLYNMQSDYTDMVWAADCRRGLQ